MSEQRPPVLAACLIVKDEAGTIERCLASIRPFVDEVDVYDTGSTDGTLALLARLAEQRTATVDGVEVALARIRVEHGDWRDDFGWARNRSFELASPEAEWIVWADADDEIVGGATLRELAAAAPPDVDGLMCAYDLPREEGGVGARFCQARVLRAASGFRWAGRAHETLVLADRTPHFQLVDPARLRWVHRKPVERWSPARNLELLLRERTLAEEAGRPLDLQTLMHIGIETAWLGDFAAAAPYLGEYLDRTDGWGDDRLVVTGQLAGCQRFLGDVPTALELELQAWAARPDWPQTALGIAQSYAVTGAWDEVLIWARRALEAELPHTLMAIPVTRMRVAPGLLLAQAQLALGDAQGAGESFAAAAQREPADEELRGLAEAFAARVGEGDPAAAAVIVRMAVSRFDEQLEALIRRAHLAAGTAPPVRPRPDS